MRRCIYEIYGDRIVEDVCSKEICDIDCVVPWEKCAKVNKYLREAGDEYMKTFWKAALIRAVKTIAQTAVSLIGVGTVMSDINWFRVGSASLLAGILSILTSIATGLPEVDR